MDMNGRLQLTIGQTEPVVLFAKGKKTNATIKGIDFNDYTIFVEIVIFSHEKSTANAVLFSIQAADRRLGM